MLFVICTGKFHNFSQYQAMYFSIQRPYFFPFLHVFRKCLSIPFSRGRASGQDILVLSIICTIVYRSIKKTKKILVGVPPPRRGLRRENIQTPCGSLQNFGNP